MEKAGFTSTQMQRKTREAHTQRDARRPVMRDGSKDESGARWPPSASRAAPAPIPGPSQALTASRRSATDPLTPRPCRARHFFLLLKFLQMGFYFLQPECCILGKCSASLLDMPCCVSYVRSCTVCIFVSGLVGLNSKK